MGGVIQKLEIDKNKARTLSTFYFYLYNTFFCISNRQTHDNGAHSAFVMAPEQQCISIHANVIFVQ